MPRQVPERSNGGGFVAFLSLRRLRESKSHLANEYYSLNINDNGESLKCHSVSTRAVKWGSARNTPTSSEVSRGSNPALPTLNVRFAEGVENIHGSNEYAHTNVVVFRLFLDELTCESRFIFFHIYAYIAKHIFFFIFYMLYELKFPKTIGNFNFFIYLCNEKNIYFSVVNYDLS